MEQEELLLRRINILWLIGIFIMIAILAACGSRGSSGIVDMEEAVQMGVAATLTKDAWLEGVESARKTAIAEENTTQEVSSVQLPGGTPTPELEAPSEDPQPSTTANPDVIQKLIPPPDNLKERVDTFLTDFNSIDYADERVSTGDQFEFNVLERPFTAEEMEYRGMVDITRTELKVTDNWIFAIIYLATDLPESGDVKYGLELDLKENGRGEILIQTNLPQGAEWSVFGVKVFQDIDGDVGGESPMYMDLPDSSLTGYEVLVFDSGVGDIPDLAWSRRNPEVTNSLQIAFKPELVAAYGGYMWSAWADDGLKSPGLWDYVDRFTEEEAGSPYPGSPLYPIKALYLIDTTCRSYFGFSPSGTEPGICP
jgi:hypothetical protein